MSTPTAGALSDGNLSPDDTMTSAAAAQRYESDDELSDGRASPVDRRSSVDAESLHEEITNDVEEDQNISESEESSPGNASEDADFDMEESQQSQHENDDIVVDRASSSDSNRASKRKAPGEEDEYIKANPELYGLRRSVQFSFANCFMSLCGN